MKEIKCPHCGKVFSVDEADYAYIVNQVRNTEFDSEVNRRMTELNHQQKTEQERLKAELEKRYIMALNGKENTLKQLEFEITQLKMTCRRPNSRKILR